VKRAELLKQLRRLAKDRGVKFEVTEGGSHSKVWLGERFVIVPRHREINELTAKGILRDAKDD
jgi:mRNA interferase HicA